MKKNLRSFKGKSPHLEKDVFLAEGSFVIGDVLIKEKSSIWYNTVVRGDDHPVVIGAYTNIQDNSTIHEMHDFPTLIGDYVTIGHGAILHGCKIGNNCLIGMGSIILSYAEIGENCIIAAGALITERKKIPPNSLVMGSPGKVIRTVTNEEIILIRESALNYAELAGEYRA